MAATTSERVRIHRENLRAAGLRPIQIWVPDVRQPGFADECARQSRIVHQNIDENDLLDFIEQATDLGHSQ
ncbi:antitoxin MazE family protein [Burkholderia cenocepacia]|uniref:antitoxin MazE family protein n=1 Tax=Burkholderia cenocepacia TaxID=95486 RepID=UPI0023B998A8|nr:antitoxin MazE family protein [Burkholderia cenocepacia]MDF0499219.1 antitoxin MazE family protein [Burkholderia cenocepacia]